MDKAPHFYAPDRASWRAWLHENHDKEVAVWLVFDKGPGRTMRWADIVEEALCYGWIDSRPGKVSDTQSKIYVSRRKPKSVWSKINKEAIERLMAADLMTPAGLKAVEIAKENGSWRALELSDNMVYPPELIELLEKHPIAKKNFDTFPPGVRRATLQWIYDAKTEATKLKRIDETIAAARENRRLR